MSYIRTCDKWVPVTTTWLVFRLEMGKRTPVRKVATYILNNQLQTADKGWSCSLGFGRGANNNSRLKCTLLCNIHIDSIGPGLMVQTKQRRRDMRLGTWNVRSLYREGSFTATARELARYKLDLVEVQGAGGTERAQ
jgi:hypothetical protein